MSYTYPPNSRYAHAPTVQYTGPDGRTVTFITARTIPQPDRYSPLALHQLERAQRVDLIADRYYGDSLQYWRICDANRVSWPPLATAQPGATLLVPLPLEVNDRGDT